VTERLGLPVLLRVEFKLEVRMSDWIAEWKKQDDTQREEERVKEQLRLQRNAMIREKLPGFWEALARCVYEDSEQLRKTLSGDQYHCEVDRDARPVTERPLIIRKVKHPFRQIEVRLNLDGHLLEIRKGTVFDTMGNVENPESETVEVHVSRDESLKFICKDGAVCRAPADLSKRFFEFLCDREPERPSRRIDLLDEE
jgi:hypothetical protein